MNKTDAFDKMVGKVTKKNAVTLGKNAIVAAVKEWVATLSNEEKEHELVQAGKAVKMKDLPEEFKRDDALMKNFIEMQQAYKKEYLE